MNQNKIFNAYLHRMSVLQDNVLDMVESCVLPISLHETNGIVGHFKPGKTWATIGLTDFIDIDLTLDRGSELCAVRILHVTGKLPQQDNEDSNYLLLCKYHEEFHKLKETFESQKF